MGKWWKLGAAAAVAVAAAAVGVGGSKSGYGQWDKETAVRVLGEWSEALGIWAIPAYVGLHTLTLALCLPYAVFFEAAASLLFGFFPGVLCVFSAKLLAASLSFSLARLVFRRWSWATEWAQRNKYFHVLSRGVKRDGWRFVLLARFSPVPSYVINYALAATDVAFFVDFLLPTVVGCLPMILQNTSIGSLAGAAVASASDAVSVWSYVFPLLGIASSLLISLRIKSYSAHFASPATTEGTPSTKDQ